jgi:hypothetical protein
MARVIPLLLALLACTYAGADDAADAEAKIREYFDAFNAQDIDSITRDVYSIPVHIANQAGHRAYITGKDAATSLAGLYEQIEEQGWVESVIREVNVCVIALAYRRLLRQGSGQEHDLQLTDYQAVAAAGSPSTSSIVKPVNP